MSALTPTGCDSPSADLSGSHVLLEERGGWFLQNVYILWLQYPDRHALSLFVKTFCDPGARIMADVAGIKLHIVGYIPIELEFDYPSHHHLSPLYRSGDWGVMEIHRRPSLASTGALLPGEMIWRHTEPNRESGIAMAALAPTFRILLNVVDSALVNRIHVRGDIALRSLLEVR